MTANRRIFLNIVATYGRSLYAFAIGLFTARWVLMSLGQVDYGLVGVIGGLTAFVSFLNSLMSGAVGRFYAFAVGQASVSTNKETGIEECRRWFSIAVAIHTVFPTVLMVIGYPIGEWAVRNFLTIPPDRIQACVWVWRFSCLSCFCGMVNVPFAAMYGAKQEIAELTIYGFVTTTVNALFLYYMVSHPGVWIVKYSLWACLLGITPQLIISIRAFFKYPECRLRLHYILDCERLKQLTVFAGSTFFGSFATLMVYQGTSILINKMLGPAANAAMSIGSNVSAQTMTLSNSIVGAISPALTNATGARQYEQMRSLGDTACTLGAVFVLVFTIPLSVEIDTVMKIWLKTPPEGAAALCSVLLWVMVIDKIDQGLPMMLFANGKILSYQIVIGTLAFSLFFFAWGFISLGMGIVGFGLARAAGKIPAVVVRLYYCKKLLDIPPSHWICKVFLPICFTIAVAVPCANIPKLFMVPSFIRIVTTTVVSELVFLPLVWFVILNIQQREYLVSRARKFLSKIGGAK